MPDLSTTQAAAAENDNAIAQLEDGCKAQSSQALIVLGYAMSVQQQPKLPLGNMPGLKDIESKINTSLDKATDNAKKFQKIILPSMRTTIIDINAYFNLQNALIDALNPGQDQQDTISLLKKVQEQVTDYESRSNQLQTDLSMLSTDLSRDSAAFAGIVIDLNSVLTGDNGVLASINNQLGSIDGKIAGAITGTVVSGLAIAASLRLQSVELPVS